MSELVLYRIRHIKSGQYFVCSADRTHSRETKLAERIALGLPFEGDWSASGAFFRQLRTIQRHLVQLCSRYKMEHPGNFIYRRVRIRDFKPAELDRFEVETLQVNVQETSLTPARLVMADAIASEDRD